MSEKCRKRTSLVVSLQCAMAQAYAVADFIAASEGRPKTLLQAARLALVQA